MKEAGGITRRLKIYYKHWQGVVFSINKKKNPAIGQPSQGELNVRPLNCKSTGQKTSSTAVYICNNVIIEWGWVWCEEWWGQNKINITASRISINLHAMQERTSVFSLSLPVGQISY